MLVQKSVVDNMTDAEVLEAEVKINRLMEAKRESLKRSFDVLAKLGISRLDDIYIGKVKQVRHYRDVTYRHPDEAKTETWNGRGRKPNWMVAYLAKFPENKRKEAMEKLAA